jgi:hypothetical protein
MASKNGQEVTLDSEEFSWEIRKNPKADGNDEF